MDDRSKTLPTTPRRILKPRKLALLASATGLSMAILVAGPTGYLNTRGWTAPAHAADTTAQSPAGFADLVAKVKPAVVSVRVKIEKDAGNAGFEPSGSQSNSDQSGSPFDRFFFRQYGFGNGNGMPNLRQVITGEGSGFSSRLTGMR
jgi:serine protease Do